ncbi:dynamin family protein [Micromonospora rifamycinica]|uniref:dynamin family protein n=1 Tax=Micromonospora rifamycinica TaxID=291594 RepID=UPI002E2D22FB|nr:dynamin family protein [Micromonospora rifamycinica]
MNDLEHLRDDSITLIDQVTAALGDELPTASATMLAGCRDRLRHARYHLVVCGEFRQGKSSLLNALVERPGLFPVDIDVTTSVVTVLQWAEEDTATVHFAEDPDDPEASRPPLPVDLADLPAYVTEQGNPGNEKRVSLLVLGAPLEQLTPGLVLVDTPGIGSVNPAHTAATRAFLPRADALIFVSSVLEPVNTAELDFLAGALAQCPTVLVTITQADKVVEPEPVVEAARNRIAEVAGRPPGELTVLAVSALRKFDALEDGDPALLDESGFPALERHLWGALAGTVGGLRIDGELETVTALLDGAAAPVAIELAGLVEDSFGELDAELKASRTAAEKLRGAGQRWRRTARDDLDRAARPIRDQLSSDFDRIVDEFRRSLDSDDALTDPAAVVRQVSDQIVDAGSRAATELRRAVDEVAERHATQLEIELTLPTVDPDGPALSGTPDGTAPAAGDFTPPHRARQTSFAAFRTSWAGGMAYGGAGTLIGAAAGSFVPVVGTIVGGILGGVIGQLTGWFAGRREARLQAERQHRQDQVGALRSHVLPMLDSARRRAERQLTYQVKDYADALLLALDNQLDAQAEAYAMTERRLIEARSRGVHERKLRIAQLEERLGVYAGLQERVDATRSRARRLTHRSPDGPDGSTN